MFASRYFCNRYFAPRYWPKVGADAVADSGGFSHYNNVQGFMYQWVSGGVNHVMRSR